MFSKASLFALAYLASGSTSIAQKLLPFQGHLTSSSGETVADGTKVVQFKIYDSPVSGATVWTGEIHKLSVNNGLVNTVLGTKTAFPETYAGGTKVTFSEPLYVEITVDANSDGQITAIDPPLLPRQILLPGNFAHVAQSVRSANGTEVISDSGEIDGSHLKDASIPLDALAVAEENGGVRANQIAENAILSSELAPNSVQSSHIQDGAIMSLDLGNGQVTPAKLAENGFSGTVFQTNSVPPNRLKRDIAMFWDEKTFNENGGDSVSGLQTRTLNKSTIIGESISREGSRFTLKPGKYLVRASAPANGTNRHQIHLHNISNDTVPVVGSAEYNNHTSGNNHAQTVSHLEGIITVDVESTFEILHYTRIGKGGGLGVSSGSFSGPTTPSNIPSIYTRAYIERLE